jgi:anti-anti-sigma factor
MPAGGGTTQTAVNRQAGARTQVSELVTAAMSLVTMLFLSPLIGLMPHATLAAVVIVYSIGLVKPQEFRDILRIRRTEFIWALTAFGGVMLLGTLKGIIVAIIVSMVMLAHQVSDPPVYVMGRKRGTNIFRPVSQEHPEDETFPGLLLLRLDGRFFFANAEHIGQKVKPLVERAKPTVIALELSGVPDLEYTALKMLTEAARRHEQNGIAVWLVGLNPQVLNMVQRSPLGEMLGRDGLQFNLETTVAKYASKGGLASGAKTS